MQRLSDISPSIIWVFLFFTLSLSSATRQFIWLMALVGLVMFVRGPKVFFETEGVRKFWIVLACFLLPALFSLFGAINFERSLSGAVRFLSYGFAVWVVLQINLDKIESQRLMSLIGAVMMIWVVDGLVQLLTGFSVFGNPLIELDSGHTLVTGSLRMGYGSTLAILSPFYLEALRRAGSGPAISVLSLPLFAAIVMSGNEASMIHALAALGGYALILRRAKTDPQVTSWLLSLLLFFSLAVSDIYQAFDYLPVFWSSAWQGFMDHWVNGVGIRGWGSLMVSLESISVLPVSERWHPHLFALEVAVDTGIPGLIGYALFFVFLSRRLFDSRPEVALSSLVVILALFPLNSSISFYSYFNGNILFLTLALLIVLDRDIKTPPQVEGPYDGRS
jgi:hypothetical protein